MSTLPDQPSLHLLAVDGKSALLIRRTCRARFTNSLICIGN